MRLIVFGIIMHSLYAATGKRWAILIACLVLLSAFLPSIGQSGTVSTVVAVIPGKVVVDVGDVFAVDIWIYNVTNMAGWDFQLGWNTSMLFCTKARVNTPAEWGGTPFDWFNKEASEVNVDDVLNAWQFGPGINNTEGTYNKCECFGPSIGNHRNPYNGSLAIVTLWFRALQTGTTTLEFSKLYQGWLPNVHLSDPYPHPIPKVEYDGLVEIREPINIPTQQAVWLKK